MYSVIFYFHFYRRAEGELPCFSDIGVPVQREVVFGWKGEPCDRNTTYSDPCSACVQRADKFVLSFLLDYHGTTDETRYKLWEKEVMIHHIEQLNEDFRVNNEINNRMVYQI